MTAIAVVGGGIGGLLVARELAKRGYSIRLFEEHESFGAPRHCTGLVSQYTFESLGSPARESVVRRFYSYDIVTCNFDELVKLVFNEPVYLLDRELLEKVISMEAVGFGADLKLRSYVSSVECDGKVEVVKSCKEKYDYVVLAEGAVRVLSARLGMCSGELTNLVGLQAVAKIKGLILDNPLIIACSKLCRDFFAWIVPYDEDTNYIVGVATEHNINASFTNLLKLIGKYFNVNIDVIKHFGGLIPIDKPCSPIKGKVVGIGDSISTTKPLSGGGIYSIVLEVRALVDALEKNNALDLNVYYRELAGLFKMLSLQHNLRKFLISIGGYEKIIRTLFNLGISKIAIGNYDRLVVDVIKTIRNLFS
ncbi:MAG: NAD(P)/FAD-dependent oxidoreductase [Desulfurococcales archaeon]|nr:NAD(P)/FAD-dependent oxidoreductase [Desulfurococcales archaeon]